MFCSSVADCIVLLSLFLSNLWAVLCPHFPYFIHILEISSCVDLVHPFFNAHSLWGSLWRWTHKTVSKKVFFFFLFSEIHILFLLLFYYWKISLYVFILYLGSETDPRGNTVPLGRNFLWNIPILVRTNIYTKKFNPLAMRDKNHC